MLAIWLFAYERDNALVLSFKCTAVLGFRLLEPFKSGANEATKHCPEVKFLTKADGENKKFGHILPAKLNDTINTAFCTCMILSHLLLPASVDIGGSWGEIAEMCWWNHVTKNETFKILRTVKPQRKHEWKQHSCPEPDIKVSLIGKKKWWWTFDADFQAVALVLTLSPLQTLSLAANLSM